jgi:hypothetical protein
VSWQVPPSPQRPKIDGWPQLAFLLRPVAHTNEYCASVSFEDRF